MNSVLMDRGAVIVLSVVIVLGLSLFSFSNNQFTGSFSENVNHRSYCESVCGGDTYFRQSEELRKESFSINVNDYFIVRTLDELAVFRFEGISYVEGSTGYISLQKVFSSYGLYEKKDKLYCSSSIYVNIPVNIDLPVYTIEAHPSSGDVYEFSIPVGSYEVKARLLKFKSVGHKSLKNEIYKLHVDLNNDGNLGGEVSQKSFKMYRICHNVEDI